MPSKLLLKHGTGPIGLTPSSVIHTAEADLRRAARLKQQQARRAQYRRDLKLYDQGLGSGKPTQPEFSDPSLKPYAFCRNHVMAATSPAHLLDIAAADEVVWPMSTKMSVHILYCDKELLSRAKEMCQKEHQNGQPG